MRPQGVLLQELSRKYPPLLRQKEYCEFIRKAESTAEQDRLYGRGAPFIRIWDVVFGTDSTMLSLNS